MQEPKMSPVSQLSADPAVSKFAAEVAERKTNVAKLEGERDNAARSPAESGVAVEARMRRAGSDETSSIRTVADIDRDLQVERESLRLAQKDLTAAETAASQRIAEDRKPEYVAILRRGAKAVAALRQFILDERAWRDSMDAAGIRFVGVVPPAGLAAIDETYLDHWSAEVATTYGI
jgi:hypothetical protein